jgi:hypothetical protein
MGRKLSHICHIHMCEFDCAYVCFIFIFLVLAETFAYVSNTNTKFRFLHVLLKHISSAAFDLRIIGHIPL